MKAWQWMVAFRYSRSSAADQLVSFMSLVSIFGLVLGVAILVIVLSVMNGFERELRVRVLGVLPHGVVFSERGFDDWDAVAEKLLLHPEVIAVAPYAEGSGLVVANREVSGIRFYGIDPAREPDVSILGNFLLEGDMSSLSPGSFKALIGSTLAGMLNVGVGDRVTLVLPDAQLTLAGPLPRTRRFEISGIFEVGADADKNQVLLNITDANRLRRVHGIDALRIRVDDLFEAPRVLSEVLSTLDSREVFASSWARRYGNLYDAIQVQKSTMFLLLLILVAVAAFNVVSNLVMTVDDKRGDIAILRTIGASPGSILSVFIMHGALVGAIGVATGLLVGVLVTSSLSDIYVFVDGALGLGLMDEYFVHYLPTEILVSDIVTIGIVSMVICLIATLYPALKAARSRPVEALQYDI